MEFSTTPFIHHSHSMTRGRRVAGPPPGEDVLYRQKGTTSPCRYLIYSQHGMRSRVTLIPGEKRDRFDIIPAHEWGVLSTHTCLAKRGVSLQDGPHTPWASAAILQWGLWPKRELTKRRSETVGPRIKPAAGVFFCCPLPRPGTPLRRNGGHLVFFRPVVKREGHICMVPESTTRDYGKGATGKKAVTMSRIGSHTFPTTHFRPFVLHMPPPYYPSIKNPHSWGKMAIHRKWTLCMHIFLFFLTHPGR